MRPILKKRDLSIRFSILHPGPKMNTEPYRIFDPSNPMSNLIHSIGKNDTEGGSISCKSTSTPVLSP